MTSPIADRRGERRFATAVLAGFAVLVAVRMPLIVLDGRFWAEEGRYFFVDAWSMPPGRALFAVIGGYLNLVANAATLLARYLLPLRLAPYGTIAVALAIQLAPPALLITATDPWLRPRRVRAAGALLLLLVPDSEEIWLQTLHCQFELTLCAALLLAFRAVPGRAEIPRLALLGLAPLCGPGAIALVPLFALRCALGRDGARLRQFAVLTVGAAVQLGLFFQPLPGRAYALHPASLLAIVALRHLVVPFLGASTADGVARGWRATLAAGHVPVIAVALPISAAIALAAGAFRAGLRASATWLLLASGMLASCSYFGAIGGDLALVDPHFGERYTFVPQALLGLAILSLATLPSRIVALPARLAAAWLILAGASTYFSTWKLVATGPAWRPEVAAWRADPHRPLRIWPNGWTMTLPPR